MNQKIWGGITASFLTTVLGTTTSTPVSSAETVVQTVKGNSDTQLAQELPSSATAAIKKLPAQPTPEFQLAEFPEQLRTASTSEIITNIYAYQLAGRQAATLYVRSIPVLTFLGSQGINTDPSKDRVATEVEKIATPSSVAPGNATISDAKGSENDSIQRAQVVAARINELHRNNVNAESITVRWNGSYKSYSIQVNEEELVQVDENTILPDTTKDLAEDALQATNRLRRLIGYAPPLKEIADLPPAPKPRRVQKVARSTTRRVRSQMRGMASWYGPGFHGRRTASGERFNQYALTAAHRTLRFGTRVRVTNMRNGRSVIVRINDRGPHSRSRLIDLSRGAARVIGLERSGTAAVRLEVLY
ncbi:MAG: septal ring lytic transglycosylase RlpA family protein [Moorea sp. SIO1G6]|uniref:septal ring lytic transglycosylase RlpA family protein n=1 Tax=Moorena sp. SIO1G6 TaxID=2607840 RepID=UPI0013BF122B|nr:septal ring lytic transglycosylase RlpA family protein [Moorena sp. SIO1G6]NES85881.1 septal ring lytic transglycosylase RlpA family protein [Moorena sp. SIO2B7]NET67165.1 septal ring lytic transglycosylase RlpA family protein [Moorena sp. SIO1G6]